VRDPIVEVVEVEVELEEDEIELELLLVFVDMLVWWVEAEDSRRTKVDVDVDGSGENTLTQAIHQYHIYSKTDYPHMSLPPKDIRPARSQFDLIQLCASSLFSVEAGAVKL
jgi:hypothetical protein